LLRKKLKKERSNIDTASTFSNQSLIKRANLREKLEFQQKMKAIEEQKREMVIQSLEFITGDSNKAKLLRLARPTVASKNKKMNNARYAKAIKK
jgi:cobalamin biosynthesis Co2+ chelatase CbiK